MRRPLSQPPLPQGTTRLHRLTAPRHKRIYHPDIKRYTTPDIKTPPDIKMHHPAHAPGHLTPPPGPAVPSHRYTHVPPPPAPPAHGHLKGRSSSGALSRRRSSAAAARDLLRQYTKWFKKHKMVQEKQKKDLDKAIAKTARPNAALIHRKRSAAPRQDAHEPACLDSES